MLPKKKQFDRPARTFVDRSVKSPPKLRPTVDDSLDGIPSEVIAAVLARANGKCEMCDRHVGSGIPFEMSHSIARGMGGTHGEQSHVIHSAENIRYLCILCHRNLFHHERLFYNRGTPLEQSCDTCWLSQSCSEVAAMRGILPAE